MIGHLRGTVLAVDPEELVLEVGGVGYRLAIPLSTYYEVDKAGVGSSLSLYVHTHVREDAIALFGFSTPGERTLFERLIAVSGIGPKLARVALSGMAPGDLVAAIRGGDVARLATIPGIGKKTAERMVLELRDKLADLDASAPATAPSATSGSDDLLTALVNLGYRAAHAERAVAEVSREEPDAEFPELLRLALKRLAGL